MDELPKISPEQLKSFLHGYVDEFAEKVVDNVNAAAPGRLIADSEEGVRELIDEFGRAAFEAVLQQKVDAAEAAFPPSAGNGDRRGDQAAGEETTEE